MLPLILICAGIAAAALAVTWYAVVTAEEGYEDETGFHPIRREKRRRPQPEARAAEPAGTKDSSEIRPCATLR
jgi:hypothetical protein